MIVVIGIVVINVINIITQNRPCIGGSSCWWRILITVALVYSTQTRHKTIIVICVIVICVIVIIVTNIDVICVIVIIIDVIIIFSKVTLYRVNAWCS